MKSLKTSNILLIIFGIAILVILFEKVINSTYHPNNNAENAVYTELKMDKIQPFTYLALKGYRAVTYEVKSGNAFKIEVFSDPRNTDSLRTHFSKDTLYLNIVNIQKYTSCASIPDVKISIPTGLIHILINRVHADIIGFQQDSLNITIIKDKKESKQVYREYEGEYSNIDIKDCNIKTLNFSGRNSELSIDKSNAITNLNFNTKGNNSRLYLNDVVIEKLNLNQDSAEVVLSGKAINNYLTK
jgi:hypothetical protein